MSKLHKTIFINAPVKKVWDTMLGDTTYRQWTEAFNPGSYYKGSWEKGSKILFLGPSPKGDGEGGMVGQIKDNRLHEFISIEYMGTVENGVEDTTSEEAKKWASSYENYTFTEKDGGTELAVEAEAENEYTEMLEDMWPKASQTLKELSEKN